MVSGSSISSTLSQQAITLSMPSRTPSSCLPGLIRSRWFLAPAFQAPSPSRRSRCRCPAGRRRRAYLASYAHDGFWLQHFKHPLPAGDHAVDAQQDAVVVLTWPHTLTMVSGSSISSTLSQQAITLSMPSRTPSSCLPGLNRPRWSVRLRLRLILLVRLEIDSLSSLIT